MVLCVAKNCKNRSSKKTQLQIALEVERKMRITFHQFPKNDEIRKIWLKNIGLTEAELPPSPFLCSVHFTDEAFNRTSVNSIRLHPNSIPKDCTAPICTESTEKVETQTEPHDLPHQSLHLPRVLENSVTIKNKPMLIPKRLFMGDLPVDCLKIENPVANQLQELHCMEADNISEDENEPSIKRQCIKENTENTLESQDAAVHQSQKITVEQVFQHEVVVDETCISSYNEPNVHPTLTTRSTSVSPDHFRLPTEKQYADKATSVSPKLHFDSPRKCYLRTLLKDQAESHAQEMKLLKQKCQRREKKIASLQHILSELRRKNLLQGQDIDILGNIGGFNSDLLKRLANKSNNESLPKSYSAQLRTFALTLHYYSPRAYDYVRDKFDTCLPHPKTLSRWYRSINGEPGFNNEAFECIKARANLVSYPLLGTLIFDEMAIKQHIEYDGKKFCGYTDMGKNIECETQTIAKDALVFLFVCMNGSWKIPVGYFLINGMNAEQKANLVLQCTGMLHEACVTVKYLTFDGAPVNIAMAKFLGCNLTDLNFLQPWFQHPVTKALIYVLLDPCHMLKLVRNSLGDLKYIKNESGSFISWKYIEALHDVQENEGLHLGNKLRQSHVNFHKQKMKVRLATQVFSKSVADALEVCEKHLHLPQFQNCAATCEFIIIFNDLFDIFNSKSIRANGLKKALSYDNIQTVTQYLDRAKQYILGLEVADRKIVETGKRTGFIGFLMCIESLKASFEELCIQQKQLQYIPTYKISQDHLELFFGCVRARGGHNNNPTVRQFASAFKRILIHTELRATSTGNCVALETISILHVSSRSSSAEIINASTPATRLIEGTVDTHTNITDHDYLPDIRVISQFADKIIAYIAGFVVKQLKTTLNCVVCVEALSADHNCLQNGRYSLITHKNRGGLSYPSIHTFKICQLCEKVIRQALHESGGKFMKKAYTGDYLLNKVLYDLTYNRFIFDNLSDHAHEQMPLENHRLHLSRVIAQKYLKTRLYFVGEKCNSAAQSERHKSNKLILFKGM